MNFPSGNWNAFQPLSGPEYAKDQQAIAEHNQLGQLQIDTRKQELESENALAPYKLQQAGQENDLKRADYENAMIGEVAQRAQAADPGDAPNVWDDGMQALADKGIGTANQYIGHYRPDLAEKVYGTYGGAEASGGGRGSRAAGGGGASEGGSPNFDADTVNRALAQTPVPQLQKSLQNLNRAIGSFNNVKDADSWKAEIQALKESGIDPSKFLPSLDWNPMNYAAAHRMIQNLTQYRDAVSDRLSAIATGLPGTTPKPLYEPNIQYIGTDQTTGKAQGFDTHTGKPLTISTGAIAPKPSAGVANTLLKQKMWLSVHPNDEAGALQFVNGKRSMDPGQIQLSALTEANRELYDITAGGQTITNPEQWVKNRQAEIVQQVTQANGTPAGSGAPAARAPARTAPRLSQADIQASIANARAALKRHPDKRGVIVARLKAAGVPTAGF